MKRIYGVLFVIILALSVLHWPIEVRETIVAPSDSYWNSVGVFSISYKFNTSFNNYLRLRLNYYLDKRKDDKKIINLTPISNKTIEIIDVL